MARFNAFNSFEQTILDDTPENKLTRIFHTNVGIRMVTLPETKRPPAIQLPFDPILPRGAPWQDYRYIGHGAFVRRDLWLFSFTHRLNYVRSVLSAHYS